MNAGETGIGEGEGRSETVNMREGHTQMGGGGGHRDGEKGRGVTHIDL